MKKIKKAVAATTAVVTGIAISAIATSVDTTQTSAPQKKVNVNVTDHGNTVPARIPLPVHHDTTATYIDSNGHVVHESTSDEVLCEHVPHPDSLVPKDSNRRPTGEMVPSGPTSED